MLLGFMLAGASLGLRRWLASGPSGRRSGYTAARILRGDTDLLEAGARLSVAWQDRVHQPPSASAESAISAGGRSGGAGGGASY